MSYSNRTIPKFSSALIGGCLTLLLTSCASTLDGVKTDLGGVLDKTRFGNQEQTVEPAQINPTEPTPVSAEQSMITSIQENLTALGYSPGPADGNLTSKTEAAIQDFQLDNDLRIDGRPSPKILELTTNKLAAS